METFDKRLLSFEKALDRAVLDGDKWVGVCDEIASFFGGIGGCITGRKVEARNNLVASDEVSKTIDIYLNEEWFRRDPRHKSYPLMLQRGYVTDYDVVGADGMMRDPFYADFVRRHKVEYWMGIHLAGVDHEWVAAVQFKLGSSLLSDDLLRQVSAVKRGLESALRSSSAIGSSRMAEWRSYFEGAGHGFIVLSSLGYVLEMNEVAESLVSLSPVAQRRSISISDPDADKRLQALLRWAVSRDKGLPQPPPVMFKTAKGINLSFDAFRPPSGLLHFYSDIAALVVIKPVEDIATNVADVLAREYELTAAEIRIALALNSGLSLQEAAAEYRISDGTARQQLKSVFRKTGVHTQAKLVRLIGKIG